MHVDLLEIESSPGRSAEQAPPDFFMNRFYEMNEDEIEELDTTETVREDLGDIVDAEKNRLGDQLEEFEEVVGNKLANFMIRPLEASIRELERELGKTPEIWVFDHEEVEGSVTMLLLGFSRRRRHRPPRHARSTRCLLLANESSQIDEFLQYFQDEIDRITDVAGSFVNLQRFDHGQDHVKNHLKGMTNNDYVEQWRVEDSDDEFEQEVFESVTDLTAIALPNVNLQLDHGENPEYDIISLPLGRLGEEYAIEVKNYEREELEEVDDPLPDDLRYRLITQPKEEAGRVDLDLITVVKGLGDEQYNDLQRHAEPSGVVLLNEDNYETRLREVLIEGTLNQLSKDLF